MRETGRHGERGRRTETDKETEIETEITEAGKETGQSERQRRNRVWGRAAPSTKTEDAGAHWWPTFLRRLKWGGTVIHRSKSGTKEFDTAPYY